MLQIVSLRSLVVVFRFVRLLGFIADFFRKDVIPRLHTSPLVTIARVVMNYMKSVQWLRRFLRLVLLPFDNPC